MNLTQIQFEELVQVIYYRQHIEGVRIDGDMVKLTWMEITSQYDEQGKWSQTRTPRHKVVYHHHCGVLVKAAYIAFVEWYTEWMKHQEAYERAEMLNDQATERRVEQWFEERGYGY
ncbi:hypothetical protein AH156_19840 [Salmonella enterica subsp. enterica serovar Enteritidis]|nr:hypothetical protein [Salmonella enterica subsp. enterica serovar Enteritidis]